MLSKEDGVMRTGLLKVCTRGKPSFEAELVFVRQYDDEILIVFGGQRVYRNFEVNFRGKTT